MATHQNITHEYYHNNAPSLEIWETLWEENQWRMWYNKSYSEFYNQEIVDDPSKINQDPENTAWFFKLKIKDKSEMDSLMNKDDYDKFAKESTS